MNEIPQEMIQRMVENFKKCLQQCIAGRGRHLEDFYTIYLLARFMLAEKTHVVETVRPSRAKVP